MNGFTSGTQARDGRTVNHDAKPWIEVETGNRYTNAQVIEGNRSDRCWYGLGLQPRPEFDVHDNPILDQWRDASKGLPRDQYLELLGLWLDDDPNEWTLEGQLGVDTNEELRKHARRVLSKLEVFCG